MELGIAIGNLNPDSIICQYQARNFHTRVVNFNHFFEDEVLYLDKKNFIHRLAMITPPHNMSKVKYQAMFLAPEQVLWGLENCK